MALESVGKTQKKSLADILQTISKYPENVQYRTLLFSNASVVKLLDEKGVRECLLSVGFRPRFVTNEKDGPEVLAYVLREPDVEKEFEAWSAWFDTLKAAYERCK